MKIRTLFQFYTEYNLGCNEDYKKRMIYENGYGCGNEYGGGGDEDGIGEGYGEEGWPCGDGDGYGWRQSFGIYSLEKKIKITDDEY